MAADVSLDIGHLDVHLRRRQHIDHALAKRPRLPQNLRQLGARGAVTRPSPAGSQRTVVKVVLPPTGGQGTRQHLAYLQYEKGPQRSQAPLYGPGARDPGAFARTVQADTQQFRLIVSTQGDPLGAQRTAFIEALVHQMERDLGRSLEWVAANHYDRAHAHTHLVLRGVAAGKPWYMTRSYFMQGIRERADALLTRMLGRQQEHTYRQQVAQAWVQERLVLNGMVRGTGDPDLGRLVRQQTAQAQVVMGQMGTVRHTAGDAPQTALAQLQQRVQALQHQQQAWQQGQRRRG